MKKRDKRVYGVEEFDMEKKEIESQHAKKVLEMDKEKRILSEELSKLRYQFVQMEESNKEQILAFYNIIGEKDVEIVAKTKMIQKLLTEYRS